ncbi:MAG: CotH kinase family protein [Actinobacteria bacterium]|nr:CotH kinase family protein [Actinomycetota bacterium]
MIDVTTTGDVTMAQVNADKAHQTAATATLSLSDPTNAANNIAPTANGEIKGRGNYTWQLGTYTWIGNDFKRPYQIKFDKKTKVLGMSASKNWVLLANATDGSLMRNKVALDLARAIGMPFTSNSRFADVRVNGTCYGNYLVTEKVEAKTERVGLTDPRGIIVEQNNNMGDATNPMEDYYFRSSTWGNLYSIKDSVGKIPDPVNGVVQPLPADVQAGWDDMKATLNKVESLLDSSSPDWQAIGDLIDVDSFVKYYFVYETTENPEVVAASVYFYKNGPSDKVHAGPVWDFDSALFNYDKSENYGADPVSEFVKNGNWLRRADRPGKTSSPLFQNMFRNPQFVDRANQLWNGGIGAAVMALPGKVDGYQSQIASSAAADPFLKRILGKNTLLVPGQGHSYASSFNGEVAFLKSKLSQRVNFLNSAYGTVPTLTQKGYVQSLGWRNSVMTGQFVGTTGQSLRLEGFTLAIQNKWGQSGGLEAQSHVQNVGWNSWSSSTTVGRPGQGLRMEAVKLRLTGAMAANYDISYRVHVATLGWQGWVTNGAQAGTTGQSLGIEAIQIRLLLKPGATPQPCTAGSPTSFSDVSSDYQFYNEITSMATKGIMSGYDNGCGGYEFRPWNTVTRGDMAGFLYRAAGSPAWTAPTKSPFVDVPTTDPSYKEITWLASKGITTGWVGQYGQEFRENDQISREAMAAFLYRFAGSPAWTAPAASPFTDVDPATNIFYKEITWLADTGISKGWQVSGGYAFKPKDAIQRDAMAAFLYRYLAKFPVS